MRALWLAVALAATAPAYAAEDDAWVEVGRGDEYVVSAQRGSFRLAKNKAGEDVALVSTQHFFSDTSKFQYRKQYVTTADCIAGEGKLTFLGTDGEWLFDMDFNRKGGSVASAVGDFICSVWEQDTANRKAKSI